MDDCAIWIDGEGHLVICDMETLHEHRFSPGTEQWERLLSDADGAEHVALLPHNVVAGDFDSGQGWDLVWYGTKTKQWMTDDVVASLSPSRPQPAAKVGRMRDLPATAWLGIGVGVVEVALAVWFFARHHRR